MEYATLNTSRLELIPATSALVRKEMNDLTALSASLNATLPSDWPPEEVRDALPIFVSRLEEIESRDAEQQAGRWVVYYWVSTTAPRQLVGSGGFMSPPDETGTVEIGYGTHADFRRRGYAAEAVRALAEFANAQPEVKHVVADALPENVGSVKVLTRSGFLEVGAGAEEGTRRFEFQP